VRFQDYIDTTQRAVSPLLASGGGGVRAAAASAVAVLPLCGKDPDGWAHAASRVCVEAHAMVEQVSVHCVTLCYTAVGVVAAVATVYFSAQLSACMTRAVGVVWLKATSTLYTIQAAWLMTTSCLYRLVFSESS
jgi:hypothetical protein